jgi:hypothetical protein
MRLPLVSKKILALTFACMVSMLSALALVLFVRMQNEKALARSSGGSSAGSSGARLAGFPKLFLWAWERPERLDFINPREVGVAFLARTIYLREDKVILRPRMQPLDVPEGTTLVAVVRIEALHNLTPALSDAQRAQVLEALVETTRAPNVYALQIDFDALQSEREFYKSLLQNLRARMPQGMPLSITALASWCVNDNWLDKLPIDEAVPMLFRMGLDDGRIKSYLNQGGAFRSPLCRLSKGVSTDEPLTNVSPGARTYVFHPTSGTVDDVRRAIERNRE